MTVEFKKDSNFIHNVLLLYVKHDNANVIKCPHLSILGTESKDVYYYFVLFCISLPSHFKQNKTPRHCCLFPILTTTNVNYIAHSGWSILWEVGDSFLSTVFPRLPMGHVSCLCFFPSCDCVVL